MAGLKLRPIGLIVLIVVAAKLVLHPLLVALGVSVLGDPLDWGTIAILVAAGPCGAMPFVIAVQYAIPVDRIAKAMLISMVLSVFSLSLFI